MSSATRHLTTRGRAFLSAGLTSLACAVFLGLSDLVRVGLLVVALPLLCLALVTRQRHRIVHERRLSRARVAVGEVTEVAIDLRTNSRGASRLLLLEDGVPYTLGQRPRFVVDELRAGWHRSLRYTIRPEVRGRYAIGPLAVRMADPFGLVEVQRAFRGTTSFVVTPRVYPLPPTPVSGDFSGAGDNRPRAFAATGTEDVTVREYDQGDDVRRIHWRATAHHGDLMVRREEQPHQSRATILLDTRAAAHAGSGPTSSFEYAVSIAASVLTHLSLRGYTLRMLTEHSDGREAPWHERGISGPAELQLTMDQLAVVQTNAGGDLSHVLPAGPGSHGVLIAVLGALSGTDTASLALMRPPLGASYAFLLDTDRWAGGAERPGPGATAQAASLSAAGWRVVITRPDDDIATLWGALTGAARGAPAGVTR